MAITTPYSLQLTKNEDARDAVAGNTPDGVGGTIKIFLGANVDPSKGQSIQGTLRNCLRYILNERGRFYTGAGTYSVFGPVGSTYNDLTLNPTGTLGIGDDDVAIVITGSFVSLAKGATHFIDETARQLMRVLLERTKGN